MYNHLQSKIISAYLSFYLCSIVSFAAAEQLEKSRDIIKQLKEEKNKIVQELESKIQERDDQIELKKEKLVHEIALGRSAAIKVMQVKYFCVCFIDQV